MTPRIAFEAPVLLAQAAHFGLAAVPRWLSGRPTDLQRLNNDDPTLMIVVVSIVGGLAIVCAIVAGAVAITRIAVRHRERMARIGMGIDPDTQESLSGLPLDHSFAATRSQGPPQR